MTRFASVVLDADSTLAALEGIDWLAGLRGDGVREEVAGLTDRAMAGDLPLDAVYAKRVALIAPTEAEIEGLGRAYVDALDPTALAAVVRLREAGVEVRVVSGGLRRALLPMTRVLGVDDADVHAVEIRFDTGGAYAGLEPSPLATQQGKPELVTALGLPRPVLAVGDGATDLAMRPVVDAFAAYVGVVRREAVVAGADLTVSSMAEVAERVLERG